MAYDPTDAADKKIVADLIKVALAEQATEHEQDIQGLKDKNIELLGKLKKAQEGQTDAKEVARLEEALEKNQTELKEANKSLKLVNKELNETKTNLESEAGIVKTLLVDNGLTEALTAHNVAAPFIPAVKKLLAENVALKDVDGKRIAVVGDKSLGDYIKEWSQGDEGKHYVSAPANGGTGARGANQTISAGTKQISRAAYEANPGAYAGDLSKGAVLTD